MSGSTQSRFKWQSRLAPRLWTSPLIVLWLKDEVYMFHCRFVHRQSLSDVRWVLMDSVQLGLIRHEI